MNIYPLPLPASTEISPALAIFRNLTDGRAYVRDPRGGVRRATPLDLALTSMALRSPVVTIQVED